RPSTDRPARISPTISAILPGKKTSNYHVVNRPLVRPNFAHQTWAGPHAVEDKRRSRLRQLDDSVRLVDCQVFALDDLRVAVLAGPSNCHSMDLIDLTETKS